MPAWDDLRNELDAVLAYALREPVRKSLDPNDPQDFLKILESLQSATRGLVRADEAKALREALDALNVDWRAISDDARRRVVDAARQAVSPSPVVEQKVGGLFEARGQEIASGARVSTAQRFGFQISVAPSEVNQQVITRAASAQSHFIRNEYGRRSIKFGQLARDIVAEGLARGDGSRDIGRELERRLSEQHVKRSRNYWNGIAGVFANRARAYANLSAFSDAGVSEYEFRAVLDERTSTACRFMHGKRFSVAAGLEAFAATDALRNPTSIADTQPWISEGRDDDGNAILYSRDASGARTTLARIEEKTQAIDATGKFSKSVSDKRLSAMGINTPPVHFHCRSTIIPIVGLPGRTQAPNAGLVASPVPVATKPVPPVEVQFARELHGNLKAWDNASTHEEKSSASRAIREGMRGLIEGTTGLRSRDIAHRDVARNDYGTEPTENMLGADAIHDWQGKVTFREGEHLNLKNAALRMKQLERGKYKAIASKSEDFRALKTLVHEELHGMSPVRSSSYSGVGRGMEEAQTEVMARLVTRRLLARSAPPGEGQAFVDEAFPLPKRGPDGRYSGDHGYDEYISHVMQSVGDIAGHDGVGRRVEEAFERLMTIRSKHGKKDAIETGGEHVDAFVAALDLGDRKKEKAIMRALKNSRGPLAKRWVPASTQERIGQMLRVLDRNDVQGAIAIHRAAKSANALTPELGQQLLMMQDDPSVLMRALGR